MVLKSIFGVISQVLKIFFVYSESAAESIGAGWGILLSILLLIRLASVCARIYF